MADLIYSKTYTNQVKAELLHVPGKAARSYQSPEPSRTLRLACYWKQWSHIAKNSRFVVKGMSTKERAQYIGGHCDTYGIRHLIGGDVSAWDSSWSPALKELSRVIDAKVFGQYKKATRDCHRTKVFKNRHVRLVVEALHYSGDSDNTEPIVAPIVLSIWQPWLLFPLWD